jgi:hypothetical protein
MINLRNIKRKDYSSDDLEKLKITIADSLDKSRVIESETIVDLEKHLWLANAAAATISISFISKKDVVVTSLQYYGSWSFIIGIIMLVVVKFLSEYFCSRDRSRLQAAKSKFDADEVTDMIFDEVRDRFYRTLKYVYIGLKYGSGAMFIIGLVFMVQGVKITL